MNRSTLLTRSAVAAVAAVLPVTLVASPASAATQAIGCSTTYGGVSKYRQATVTDGVVLGPTTFSSNVTNNGSSRYLFSSSLDVQVWTKNGYYKVANAWSTSTRLPGQWGTVQWHDKVYEKRGSVYHYVTTVYCKTYR